MLIPLASRAQLTVFEFSNSAYRTGIVPRGGSLATIECSGLPLNPGLIRAPVGGPLPFRLADIEVLVNGGLSPILSVYIPTPEESATGARQRIEIQVPLERNASIEGSRLDYAVPEIRVRGEFQPTTLYLPAGGSIGGGLPGGWFKDSSLYLTAEHTSDGSPVTHGNPAKPGETITVYANDFFRVWPPPPIGVPVPSAAKYENEPEMDAALAGRGDGFEQGRLYLQAYSRSVDRFCTDTPSLRVLFRGLAPGKIGVQRIDFLVPLNQAPGDWPLFFNIGSPADGSGNGCRDNDALSSDYGLLIVR